jgi:hypothetical protein
MTTLRRFCAGSLLAAAMAAMAVTLAAQSRVATSWPQ